MTADNTSDRRPGPNPPRGGDGRPTGNNRPKSGNAQNPQKKKVRDFGPADNAPPKNPDNRDPARGNSQNRSSGNRRRNNNNRRNAQQQGQSQGQKPNRQKTDNAEVSTTPSTGRPQRTGGQPRKPPADRKPVQQPAQTDPGRNTPRDNPAAGNTQPQRSVSRPQRERTRPQPPVQTVETFDDVRRENERLEKEIWLEIAGIHTLTLD